MCVGAYDFFSLVWIFVIVKREVTHIVRNNDEHGLINTNNK